LQSVFCDLFVPAGCRPRRPDLGKAEDDNENIPLKLGANNFKAAPEPDSSNSSGKEITMVPTFI
jgi:hypothetical protein